MQLSPFHIVGIVASIVAIETIGILSARKVKSGSDWSHSSGKAGSWVVGGIILGTLIGGQSTIGTSQLAFSFGFSSWWFTLGAAIGCLILALPYAPALRGSGCTTVTEVTRNVFGRKLEMLSSTLCAIGIFLSVVAQVLSLSAILTTLFHISFVAAAVFSAATMLIFVLFGGVWSAGLGGVVKMILLLFSALLGGIVVLMLSHGFEGLYGDIENVMILTGTDGEFQQNYHNLFARGISKDLGSALSVILGVVCTQSYAQGIWAAKDIATARKGAFVAAIVAVPVGVACSFIGMYMRGHYLTPEEMEVIAHADNTLGHSFGIIETTSQAFPLFAVNHMPAIFGGILLGTMIVTAIVGGAGLTLGATTILTRDVVGTLAPKFVNEKGVLLTERLITFALLFGAAIAAMAVSGSFINDLGFLSMGLRVATIFLPLSFALFAPRRVSPQRMLWSVVLSTAALFVAKVFPMWGIEPTFVALAAGLLCCFVLPKSKQQQ